MRDIISSYMEQIAIIVVYGIIFIISKEWFGFEYTVLYIGAVIIGKIENKK